MKKLIYLLFLILPSAFSQTNNYNILDNTSTTISGGTINGTTIGATTPSSGAFTTLSATAQLTLPTVDNSITAFAGGGQTNATAMTATATFHRIATVATSLDSVRLPAAVAGAMHYVRNDAALSAQLYGASTDTINGVATATGITLSSLHGAWFICTAAGNWTTTEITASGTGSFLRQFGPSLVTPTLGAATFTTIAAGTSAVQGTVDLGDGTLGGRGLVWGGPSGTVFLGGVSSTKSTGGVAMMYGMDTSTSTNNGFVSSYSSSTARSHIIARDGQVQISADAASTVTKGTAVTPTIRAAINTEGLSMTGHIISGQLGATTPTVATNDCGSATQGTITAGGNDNAFLVTAGTAAVTSCAVTFGTAWTAAPKACVAFPANTTAAAAGTTAAYVSAISTTKVTISGAALASAAYYVMCY